MRAAHWTKYGYTSSQNFYYRHWRDGVIAEWVKEAGLDRPFFLSNEEYKPFRKAWQRMLVEVRRNGDRFWSGSRGDFWKSPDWELAMIDAQEWYSYSYNPNL